MGPHPEPSSSTTPGRRTLTDEQFARLAKLVYERAGIHFQPAKKYVLESRLARRLDELDMDGFDQYVTFLTIGPYRDDEFQEMFNRITINETSFFRNEPQLQHFETRTLPALLEARKATRRLRIWSAACSSGEEPYTLAIQVHRTLGIRLADWSVEILGTDISEKVLDIAHAGRYDAYATRSVAPAVLSRYFHQVDGQQELDPAIRQMVRFERLNLKDTLAARRFGTFDVIFCRNVMIYFDDAMKAQVVRMFHQQLADDGMLYIGHSESIRNLGVAFEPVPAPQAFAHTKGRTA